MSPAYSSNARDVFTWVGIIMYLPPHGDQQRRLITEKFREYARAIEPLVEEFGGKIHWYVCWTSIHLRTNNILAVLWKGPNWSCRRRMMLTTMCACSR